MKNFIQELQWRGMIQDMMPETEQHLLEGIRSAYVDIFFLNAPCKALSRLFV